MSATQTTQLQSLVAQSLALFLVGLGVYFASRMFKIRTAGWVYGDPKRSALWGLGGYLIAGVILSLMVFSASRSATPSLGPIQVRYDSGRFVNQLIGYLILVSPALLIMLFRKEPWQSSGVTRCNFFSSSLIGLGIGAVSIFTSDALY
jgi:hypothetical protein